MTVADTLLLYAETTNEVVPRVGTVQLFVAGGATVLFNPNAIYADQAVRMFAEEHARLIEREHLIAQARHARPNQVRWIVGNMLVHSGRAMVRLGDLLARQSEAYSHSV